MVFARKILIPTLTFFALVLLALVAYFLLNNISAQNTEENRYLNSLDLGLQTQLSSMGDLAVALATNVANDPEIQAAFAQGDRARLTELTMDSYLSLRDRYDIPQYQFTQAPATVFLRLNQLDQFGDDVSSTRPTIVDTNTYQRIASGVELSSDGLSMRGVVPVNYLGSHIGSVEFGSRLDLAFLIGLKDKFGADWHIMLLRQAMEAANLSAPPGGTEGPTPDLVLQASTMVPPIFAQPENYARVITGQTVASRVNASDFNYSILSVPLRDFSGNMIGVVDIVTDRTAAVATLRNRLILALLASFVGLGLGGAVLTYIIRNSVRPIQELTDTATAIAEGDIDREVPVPLRSPGIIPAQEDEITRLGMSFKSMTQQVRGLIGGLELAVARRTRDLERRAVQLQVASDVAREAAAIRDLEQLLKDVVSMISERFGYYHAGLFLLSEPVSPGSAMTGASRGGANYAELRAASSDGGQRMLARRHRLEVGRVGIVGYVAATGQPRIALDVGQDAVFFNNPDLPQTRSEMALPLKIQDRIIGVLDVQSTEPSAFSQEDVSILQILADQVALAIENTHLLAESKQALSDVESLYQQQVRQGWQQYLSDRSLTYILDQGGIKPLPADRSSPIESEASGDVQAGQHKPVIEVPIELRGQRLGALRLRKDEEFKEWTDQEKELLQETVSQIALSLENARLLEEIQSRADQEEMINQIVAKTQGSLDLDAVIKTAVQEVGRLSNIAKVQIRLHREGVKQQ
jgi:GAF domain-containing protein/HAMP domain-containing protein